MLRNQRTNIGKVARLTSSISRRSTSNPSIAVRLKCLLRRPLYSSPTSRSSEQKTARPRLKSISKRLQSNSSKSYNLFLSMTIQCIRLKRTLLKIMKIRLPVTTLEDSSSFCAKLKPSSKNRTRWAPHRMVPLISRPRKECKQILKTLQRSIRLVKRLQPIKIDNQAKMTFVWIVLVQASMLR